MLNSIVTVCTFLVGLAGIFGTAFMYRNTKKGGAAQEQKETMEAMRQRIDTLEGEVNSLEKKYLSMEKENNRLSGVIETICSALKQKSIFLTIEGEMITIEDNRASTRNIVRKSTRKPDTTTGGT